MVYLYVFPTLHNLPDSDLFDLSRSCIYRGLSWASDLLVFWVEFLSLPE